MTGWIPDVVPDQVIASSWGNSIRNRTVTPFPNVAARTTAIPAPVVGMLTFLDDTNVCEVYDGAAWRPLVGAGARVGYTALTAADVAQGATTTIATLTYTPATSRLVKIEAVASYTMVTGNSNGNTYARIAIDGTPASTYCATNHSLGVGGISGGSTAIFTQLTAVAHTIIIQGVNAASTGCAMRFAANNGSLAIYDYGP